MTTYMHTYDDVLIKSWISIQGIQPKVEFYFYLKSLSITFCNSESNSGFRAKTPPMRSKFEPPSVRDIMDMMGHHWCPNKITKASFLIQYLDTVRQSGLLSTAVNNSRYD